VQLDAAQLQATFAAQAAYLKQFQVNTHPASLDPFLDYIDKVVVLAAKLGIDDQVEPGERAWSDVVPVGAVFGHLR
jgi:hypothetical protein